MPTSLLTLVYTVHEGPILLEYFRPTEMEFRTFAPRMFTDMQEAERAFKIAFCTDEITCLYTTPADFAARKRRVHLRKMRHA